MSKIFTIAIREYWAMVATKAFLISIVMMPILMFGGIFAMKFLSEVSGVKERKILVYDGTGILFDPLEMVANQINAKVEKQVNGEESDEQKGGFDEKEKYVLERLDIKELTNEKRAEISQQIRDGEYYAFVEIPKNVIAIPAKEKDEKKNEKQGSDLENSNEKNETSEDSPQKESGDKESGDKESGDKESGDKKSGGKLEDQIIFRSQNSALAGARRWIEFSLTEIVTGIRLNANGIDPKEVKKASQSVKVEGKGLVELDSDGNIIQKKEKSTMATIFMPFGVMMLMFMVIFLAAQPALESVLEEKSQKIAEVLLGSANPFQLMIGKLMGVVGGSLTVFSVYITGIIYFASSQNYEIPYEILPWFVVFQILGVFFYAAMFMAVGASVNQLKEAQSMLLPIWMLMMSPMMVWFVIIQDPNGPVATGMSLFPPATPTTLMLRMATGQTVPLWQPMVGLILMILCTLFVVHIASRIFRVGILWQGKTPSLKEIFKWAFSNN